MTAFKRQPTPLDGGGRSAQYVRSTNVFRTVKSGNGSASIICVPDEQDGRFLSAGLGGAGSTTRQTTYLFITTPIENSSLLQCCSHEGDYTKIVLSIQPDAASE